MKSFQDQEGEDLGSGSTISQICGFPLWIASLHPKRQCWFRLLALVQEVLRRSPLQQASPSMLSRFLGNVCLVTLFAFPPVSKLKAAETVMLRIDISRLRQEIILNHSWHGILIYIFINLNKLWALIQTSHIFPQMLLYHSMPSSFQHLCLFLSLHLFLIFPLGRLFPALHVPDCVLGVCVFMASLLSCLPTPPADSHSFPDIQFLILKVSYHVKAF